MKGWSRAGLVLPSILLGTLLHAASGQAPAAISKDEFRARRVALADILRKELPPGSSAVLMLDSVPEPENTTFRQESHLYYLTGTEIPESALVLLFDRPAGAPRKGAGHYAEYLYLPERDYGRERWRGARPGAGGLERETLQPDEERRETMAITGFDRVPEGDYPPRRYPRGPVEQRSDLTAHLGRFLPDAEVFYHLAMPGTPGAPLTPDLAFLKQVREQYPMLAFRDPAPALERMRSVKSPAEVAILRRAIEITCLAHRDALREARAGMAEYQVQAVVEHRFTFEGARRPGYPSVVGAGPNSCVLHYDASEGVLEEGDLLLLDAGAEFRRYTADVTRTFPVSGRFTEEQRKIYDIVLRAQKAAIAAIRPGALFTEIDKAARKVITEAGFGPFFLHGTSHFIGLDVHEGGDVPGSLQASMVLAVEPGIYIPGKKIGIRIEDDVLVIPGGARILSDCAPRERDAVEMQRTEGLMSEGR